MSGFKFMGVQDDPDIDNAEARGFPRIYDGTDPSHGDYVVRVEDFGNLIREVACADLRDAIVTALQLQKEYPRHRVQPYRPDNIDLGCPTGLAGDELEAWLEVAR